MKSYESSKYYIKLWRKRWYLYIPVLFIQRNLFKEKTIDMILDGGIGRTDRKNLINSWFDIKKHIDLTKLQKYS